MRNDNKKKGPSVDVTVDVECYDHCHKEDVTRQTNVKQHFFVTTPLHRKDPSLHLNTIDDPPVPPPPTPTCGVRQRTVFRVTGSARWRRRVRVMKDEGRD